MKRVFVLAIIALLVAATACRPQAGRQKPTKGAKTTTKKLTVRRPAETAESNSSNPLAKYAHRSVVDEFNPDVTDEERRHPQPRRGGTLVVRMPNDISTLNPLLSGWLSETVILSYLLDSLYWRNSETLEYIPKMAQYWKIRDYIEKRDGTRIEGLVTSETERTVTILPGASVWTFLRSDIVSSDTKQGLLATRFGQRLRGDFTTYEYTVEVKERPSTPPLTVAKDDLSTWTDEIGTKQHVRLSIKKRCIYEFHLRPGIRWHDGAPVTMYDAKCWFDTMRNPRVDCARYRLYYIDIEKMEVPDPLTAKFTYRRPYFQALDVCAGVGFLPRHILKPERFRDDPEGYAEYFNKHPMGQPGSGQFVGMGPYKLDHWTAGQEIALVRNEDYWACRADLPYWDPKRPYLDKIIWRVIHEKTPALRALENGDVDADFDVEPSTWFLPQTNSPEFKSKYVRARFITPNYTYIGWNEKREFFKDPQVRRALTMLIPRERILKEIHHNLGRIVAGPFFFAGPCADPSVEPLPYDPVKARRLLRRARWIDRDGDGILDRDGKKFEFEYLIHTAREYHAKIADIVKQSLGKAGILVHIRKVDPTILGETVRDHNFDAVRFAWTDTLDPDPYQIWHSSQSKGRGSNYVSYANPRVDELIEKGREEFDPIKRWTMFREVYRIIHNEQPYTFMFAFDSLVFYNKKFHGVKFYMDILSYDFTEWYIAGK